MEKIINFNNQELFLIRDSVICKIEKLNKVRQWFFDNNIDFDGQKLSEQIFDYESLMKNIDSILGGKR